MGTLCVNAVALVLPQGEPLAVAAFVLGEVGNGELDLLSFESVDGGVFDRGGVDAGMFGQCGGERRRPSRPTGGSIRHAWQGSRKRWRRWTSRPRCTTRLTTSLTISGAGPRDRIHEDAQPAGIVNVRVRSVPSMKLVLVPVRRGMPASVSSASRGARRLHRHPRRAARSLGRGRRARRHSAQSRYERMYRSSRRRR